MTTQVRLNANIAHALLIVVSLASSVTGEMENILGRSLFLEIHTLQYLFMYEACINI